MAYNTLNIGDEVQSIAASRFLPQIDQYEYRDLISEFLPPYKKEYKKTKLIMNAFWSHCPYNFPPSKHIEPLLVSMHFNTDTREKLLTEKSKKYLIEHGPVGCRDTESCDWLQKNGIPAYFSGCLTLTLQGNPNIQKQKYILCVDIPRVEREIKKLTGIPVYSINRWIQPFYTYKQKYEFAKIVLRLYNEAHLVVTSRLHAMLPSLAMGTPVLRIIDKSVRNMERFAGYEGFCNTFKFTDDNIEELHNFNFDTPPDNPTKHLEYRDKLIKICSDFTGYDNSESLVDDDPFPLVKLVKMNAYSYDKVKKTCFYAKKEDLEKAIKGINKKIRVFDYINKDEVFKKENQKLLRINMLKCKFLSKVTKGDKQKHYREKYILLKQRLL